MQERTGTAIDIDCSLDALCHLLDIDDPVGRTITDAGECPVYQFCGQDICSEADVLGDSCQRSIVDQLVAQLATLQPKDVSTGLEEPHATPTNIDAVACSVPSWITGAMSSADWAAVPPALATAIPLAATAAVEKTSVPNFMEFQILNNISIPCSVWNQDRHRMFEDCEIDVRSIDSVQPTTLNWV